MAEEVSFDQLRQTLEAGGGIRCRELQKLLESLGFEVREGRKQGHRVVVHPGLAAFTSASYSCGHGTNPEIKRPYIKNIIKIMHRYESELRHYVGENQ